MGSPSKIQATLTSFGDFTRDGLIFVSKIEDSDEYHVDVQLGCDRATMETDRDSLVMLRDSLNELLAEGGGNGV